MLVYVVSDTHIPDRAKSIPDKFLKVLSPDAILIHSGDFTDLTVLKELKSRVKTLHAVWGNMDPQDVREALPEKQMVDLGEYRIGLYHGSGTPLKLEEKVYRMFPEGLDVIIFGHSHLPYNKKIKETLMFNPGSLTWNRSGSPTYGILHFEDKGVWGEIIEV